MKMRRYQPQPTSLLKCKRTACGNLNPVCRHTQTGDMYCVSCARKINQFNPGLVTIPQPSKVTSEPVSG